MTGYVVHFGIARAHLDHSPRFIYPSQAHWIVDGDGWNVWGERPGTDSNDADTLHVTVPTRSIGQALDHAVYLDALYQRGQVPLQPMTTVGEAANPYAGILISVTTDVWAEEVAQITDTARTLIAHSF